MKLKLIGIIVFFLTISTLPISVVLIFKDFDHKVPYYKNETSISHYNNDFYANEDYDDMVARLSSNEIQSKSGHTGRGITFPGTKWCGPGDRASHFEDLGQLKQLDICCRSHDTCFDYIASGQMKHCLRNGSPFTRLHCDCDNEFRMCLRQVNSILSRTIGYKYFKVKRYCFKLEYPIIGCIQYQRSSILKRCIEYQLDTMQYKKWQWFDNAFW